MQTKAATVREYLASLPEERRQAIEAIRKVIKKNIDKAFAEGIQYGMLGYYLPHSKYPDGYHCDPRQPLPFASIAAQKNHIGLYLFCVYCDPDEQARFRKEWLASGHKLDMGKSCVRAKRLEDIPLDVVGRAFARMTAKKFVAAYERSLPGGKTKPAAKKPAAKKAATKKPAAKKKVAAKKPAVKKKVAKKAAASPAKKAGRKASARRS